MGTDTKPLSDMKIEFNKTIIKSSRSQRRYFSPLTPEEMTQEMFSDFVSEHLNLRKKNQMPGPAEETVAELIRHGVPKSSVTFCFSYLSVALAHATYYLYRIEPAQGSVQVNWNGRRFTVKPISSAKDLAEAILRIDEKFPELEVGRRAEGGGDSGGFRRGAARSRHAGHGPRVHVPCKGEQGPYGPDTDLPGQRGPSHR